MRISDWSSDVCSSDLALIPCVLVVPGAVCADAIGADTAKPSATTDPRHALISALLPNKTPQLYRARAQVQKQTLPPACLDIVRPPDRHPWAELHFAPNR